MESLASLIVELAAMGPARPAITCGGRTLSFGALHDRSSQVAQAIVDAGASRGDRVAVLTKNCPEYFELLFGAAKAGVVLVALNWRLAAPEIEAIVADAEPVVLVVGSAQRPLVPPAFADRVIELETGYEPWIADRPVAAPEGTIAPDDVVLQLYSSGTTGMPKGARLTHANLMFTPRMGRETYRMGPESVNLVASPLFHVGGTGYGLTTLGQGGHTVLMAEVDPAAMLRAIEEYRVTHAFFVPSVVQMLIDQPGVSDADLSSIQAIAYGGAPMTEALLLRAMGALNCAFMDVYGMTETAGSVTCLAPEDHDPGGPRAGLLRSIGQALPWHEVRVFDPACGQESPVGDRKSVV